MRLLVYLAVLLIPTLTACSYFPSSGSAALNQQPITASASAANAAVEDAKSLTADSAPVGLEETYRIGVGDQLQVMVWRNGELSISVPVRPDGKISVPLVGDILAAGSTTVELTERITVNLEKFIRTPQVTVIVTSPISAEFIRRVRVTGAVGSPQTLPYRHGMTVLDVVLLAGGVTPFAAPNRAKIYRTTEAGSEIIEVRLKDILEKGKVDTNYQLQPSDILTVPEKLF